MSITQKARERLRELMLGRNLHAWSTLPLTHNDAMQALDELFDSSLAYERWEVAERCLNAQMAKENNDPWSVLQGVRCMGLRLVPVEGEKLELEAA